MEHNCSKCIYQYTPESVRDFYLKTRRMPMMTHWKEKTFEHLYWLCSNLHVADVDYTEPHTIYKPCIEYNFNGNCTFFKTADAIDILPSTVSISKSKITTDEEGTETITPLTDDDPIYVGDKIQLKITVTPAVIPAVTEEQEVEVQKKDEDENPLYDEETGEPIMETVIQTVTISEEHDNNQEIRCKYQWYKNGRKLFKSKTDTLIIDATEESLDEYYCVVTQSIENNGDGGMKSADVNSEVVSIDIQPKPEDTPDTPSGDDTPSDDTGDDTPGDDDTEGGDDTDPDNP